MNSDRPETHLEILKAGRKLQPDRAELEVDRLPFTRGDVEEVGKSWNGSLADSALVYFDAQASEDTFKAHAPGWRVIHLATHGYYLEDRFQPEDKPTHGLGFDHGFVGENPFLLSGLLFAGSNRHGAGCDSARLEDGVLSAYEVSALDLTGTDLVVLSACETGLGEVKAGEGVYGLRRAFQMAGARTVVSALWPIPDQETADLMARIYDRRGRSLPETLPEAQLERIEALRRDGRPDHPFS